MDPCESLRLAQFGLFSQAGASLERNKYSLNKSMMEGIFNGYVPAHDPALSIGPAGLEKRGDSQKVQSTDVTVSREAFHKKLGEYCFQAIIGGDL